MASEQGSGDLETTIRYKIYFLFNATRLKEEPCFFFLSQASSIFSSGKSNLKMSVAEWWNDTDWGNTKYCEVKKKINLNYI